MNVRGAGQDAILDMRPNPDMEPRILLRMFMLIRRRPSKAKLITIAIVLVAAGLIFAADKFDLTPDWMNDGPARVRPPYQLLNTNL